MSAASLTHVAICTAFYAFATLVEAKTYRLGVTRAVVCGFGWTSFVHTVEGPVAFDQSSVFEERIDPGPVVWGINSIVDCHLMEVEVKTAN